MANEVYLLFSVKHLSLIWKFQGSSSASVAEFVVITFNKYNK